MNEKDGADPKGNGTNDLLSKPAYSLPYDAVVAELGSRIEEGLSDDEAGRRLQHYGPNKIEEGEGVSLTKISVRQVANAMMLVLIMAMAVSFGIQSWIEGGFICAVVVLNIVVGFFQEYAAEKTMESLHSLSSPTGIVSRGGQAISVPSAEIVPGDMVELKTGDTIPADLR
jgi:Na+-exporting ATPase